MHQPPSAATTEPRSAADPFSATATPLLKWPGGKSAELDVVKRLAPTTMSRYFEPFVGGGAVYWTVDPAVPAFVNDCCADLVDVYRRTAERCPDFVGTLEGIHNAWSRLGEIGAHRSHMLTKAFGHVRESLVGGEQAGGPVTTLLGRRPLRGDVRFASRAAGVMRTALDAQLLASVTDKATRMVRAEQTRGALGASDVVANLEGAFKAALYTCLRSDYNALKTAGTTSGRRTALFLFLRDFSFAAMFRFNKSGEFNVPYGGVTYNSKNLGRRVAQVRDEAVAERLASTTIECLDFEEFLRRHGPRSGDFVFVDPPYDSEFSDYDGTAFGTPDHERLARYLIDECPAPFLLVIQDSPLVRRLYTTDGTGLRIESFNKTYNWTIKSRNDRKALHLAIRNY